MRSEEEFRQAMKQIRDALIEMDTRMKQDGQITIKPGSPEATVLSDALYHLRWLRLNYEWRRLRKDIENAAEVNRFVAECIRNGPMDPEKHAQAHDKTIIALQQLIPLLRMHGEYLLTYHDA